MNVFCKYTLQSLKKNKTRTLVTIIGIILSMSMITAVIEAAYSGLTYLRRAEVARSGAFHGFYHDLTDKELSAISGRQEIKEYASWQDVGWAKIGSKNEYKPYLLIESISDGFEKLVSVKLTEGRLPENENEIVLPNHLESNGGVSFKIGDSLTLDVGRRTSEGYDLSPANPLDPDTPEEISDTSKKNYTVVGKYDRFDYLIEQVSSPAYTALTKGGGNGSCRLFFTVDSPTKVYDFTDSIDRDCVVHRDLIRLYGLFRDGAIMRMLYSFMAILILLIVSGSVSLIYNSFSISVSERTKQFGILKSIGATGHQLGGAVLFEALVLCAVAIPIGALAGCLGIGITFFCLRDSFTFITGIYSSEVMRLVITPTGLIASALLCLITVLISAWIPARRAISVSPISAIRQNSDVRIKGKEVKTSFLTRKLFGFEGMMAVKNFKRNRKGYRATVLSLFLSVTLFISASSFCSYLGTTVNGVNSGDANYDISYYTTGENGTRPDPHIILEKLSAADGVEESAFSESTGVDIIYDSSLLDDSFVSFFGRDQKSRNTTIAFIDDASFRRLCEENGLDAQALLSGDGLGSALMYNSFVTMRTVSADYAKRYSLKVLRDSAFPCEAESTFIADNIDGYVFYAFTEDDGNEYAVYYPKNYLAERIEAGYAPEEQYAMKLTRSEASKTVKLRLAAEISKLPFFLPSSDPVIIYPYSAIDTVEIGLNSYQTDFYFKASDHRKTLSSIKNILAENNLSQSRLNDAAESKEASRMLLRVIKVFSYGFIVLISLIAASNVFNTISTNILLRRREFAMLKSIGITGRSLSRMMNYECIIYGLKGLLLGLPTSFVITFLIWKSTDSAYVMPFYIPWMTVAVAIGSVFIVVFASMLYAMRLIARDNPIDTLKNENL